ncbi:MAG: radical SAM protein [Spirochaetes bacterium]|nr:radical SAM protein [Spirochaetota bacterium]
MAATDLLTLRPFEICSIRPPTETCSLTFRLTRNCYWSRCSFCPVYKYHARFSRRSMEEVLEDIDSARRCDDAMFEHGIGYPVYTEGDIRRAAGFSEQVRRAWWEGGRIDETEADELPEPWMDERMSWFMQWFRDKPGIEECVRHILAWRIEGGTTCFLGDSDGLILKPDFLARVIARIRLRFPTVERFTIYGRTKSAFSPRSGPELRGIREAGVNRFHFGLESGNDEVLRRVNKGVTAAEQTRGLIKAREAGLSVSVYVMPGLGGSPLSKAHALDTAAMINRSRPDFVRLRSLEIFNGTGLALALKRGDFVEADEETVLREIRTLVECIDVETRIFSDSASNLLPVYGSLPGDREGMLARIDRYLDLDARAKAEFSLISRLEAFIGQYGTITGDIGARITPYVRNGTIDAGTVPDDELYSLMRYIRSRLMP